MTDDPYRGSGAHALSCPLDGSALVQGEHPSGEELHRCGACHGTWLPEDALRKILRWAERTPPDVRQQPEPRAVLAYEMGRQKHRDPVHCPRCGEETIAEERGMHSYVLVDICPSGCGTWLDDEELRRLVAHVRGRYG